MFSNSERFAVDNKTAALAVVSLTLEMLLGPGSPAWIWGGGGLEFVKFCLPVGLLICPFTDMRNHSRHENWPPGPVAQLVKMGAHSSS